MFIGRKITVLDVVDSTNEYIKQNQEKLVDGEVVCAKTQSSGRGRNQRQWVSDITGNLYASFIIKNASWLETPTHLPIFTAVVLRKAIEGEDIGFKWPNDIIASGAKLSGILIESSGGIYIVGVGVNVVEAPMIPDVKTTSLAALYGKDSIKTSTEFLSRFIEEYNLGVRRYMNTGFAPFKAEWERFCVHLNKKVALSEGIDDNTQRTFVIFKGLDISGGARVLGSDKQERTVYYGELNV
ncbi:MAG: biotin--[acetyl-CoA-carboxylase] ligase [Pseudomonadota bacterium]